MRAATLLRPLLASAVLFATALLQLAAFADAPPAKPTAAEIRRAEELFQKARALRKKDKLEEACPMFEESQRLDPNGATLLNLAECYEAFGKPGSAWRSLHEASLVAEKIGDKTLIEDVRERRKALRPKLLLVTVRIPMEVRLAPGAQASFDGAPLDVTRPTHFRVVDPGLHVVEASAPGREPFVARVGLSNTRTQAYVDVLLVEPPLVEPPPSLAPPVILMLSSLAGVGVGSALVAHGLSSGDEAFRGAGGALAGVSVVGVLVGVGWLLARKFPPAPTPPAQVQVEPAIAGGYLGFRLTGSF